MNETSMEIYMEVGACIRLCKTLMAKTIIEFSRIAPKSEVQKLNRAIEKLYDASCYADEKMFRKKIADSWEYNSVFFGATDQEPRSDIDAQILKAAQKIASKLVWEDEL